MSRLTQFRNLSPADRRLLAQAVVWVAAARCALALLKLETVSRFAQRCQRRQREASHSAERIGWAVAAAGRYVPRSTCLAEAFAAHVLMQRNGLPSVICVGVAQNVSAGFRAHAWVECAGQIAIGSAESPDFTPILRIG